VLEYGYTIAKEYEKLVNQVTISKEFVITLFFSTLYKEVIFEEESLIILTNSF